MHSRFQQRRLKTCITGEIKNSHTATINQLCSRSQQCRLGSNSATTHDAQLWQSQEKLKDLKGCHSCLIVTFYMFRSILNLAVAIAFRLHFCLSVIGILLSVVVSSGSFFPRTCRSSCRCKAVTGTSPRTRNKACKEV